MQIAWPGCDDPLIDGFVYRKTLLAAAGRRQLCSERKLKGCRKPFYQGFINYPATTSNQAGGFTLRGVEECYLKEKMT
jgi:hypothetical protein